MPTDQTNWGSSPRKLTSLSLPRPQPTVRPADHASPYAMAWTSISLGAVSGLVLGLWSFGGPVPVPDWIGEYGDLPRRFLRLAHIALFALGMLQILLARQLAATPGRPSLDRAALAAMAFGNIAMPAILIAAAIHEPVKYLLPIPALAVTFAVLTAARGAILQTKGGPG